MARTLATPQYSNAEVDRVVRAGGGQFSCRFELVDMFDNARTSPLEGVTAARVGWSAEDEIVGQLELRLLADERLRNAPYQFLVRPLFGIGPMRDGGKAEYQLGLYPWVKPRRSVLGTTRSQSEEWTITLEDQAGLLARSGPGREAYTAVKGTDVSRHIAAIVRRVGFTDVSGIEDTDALVPETVTWHFLRTTRIKKAATKKTKKHEATEAEIEEDQAESWLGVLSDLHAAGGYEQPYFDTRGVYRASAAQQWADADVSDVSYESGAASTLLLPVQSEPDLDLLANRILGTNDATNEEPAFEAVADLNKLLPSHPLCEHKIKRYLDRTYRNPLAANQKSLQREVEGVLREAVSAYDKIRISTLGFLQVHELNEIVGLRIDGDPELAGPGVNLTREMGWSLDLFTGEMEHDLRRTYRTL